jgi:hypothetical protein
LSSSPPFFDILTTGYISVHARSPYFLCCYIYKLNIGTSDILTFLNILIEILIMIKCNIYFKKKKIGGAGMNRDVARGQDIEKRGVGL